jgi:hypothetical protein
MTRKLVERFLVDLFYIDIEDTVDCFFASRELAINLLTVTEVLSLSLSLSLSVLFLTADLRGGTIHRTRRCHLLSLSQHVCTRLLRAVAACTSPGPYVRHVPVAHVAALHSRARSQLRASARWIS